MSTWSERLVRRKSQSSEAQTQKGVKNLKHVSGTGLAEISPVQPNIVESVVATGSEFQKRLLNNPMDHLNKNPQEFAQSCQYLYENFGSDFRFSVLLLIDDPLHFDATRSLRVGQSRVQAKQFFGQAKPIKIDVSPGALYSLEIQVIGAQVSELIKDELPGLSLASVVSSRSLVQAETVKNLAGVCSGEMIQDLQDLGHVATVLTVTDEISSQEDRGILSGIKTATRRNPGTVQELAHTHGLKNDSAQALGQQLVSNSTTLNPLKADQNREDVFRVHPMLTDQVVIIPLWDELRRDPVDRNRYQPNAQQIEQAATASVAIGVLATFSPRGVEQIANTVIQASNAGVDVPLRFMKGIDRQ